MGSIGDVDGETKPSEMSPSTDSAHAETQPFEFDSQFPDSPFPDTIPVDNNNVSIEDEFDSQFPDSPFRGDRDDNEDDVELNLLQDTVPVDDNNVSIEDEFETQCLNLGEETHMLNIGDETQVLDDLDCCENMETQLLDEFNVGSSLDSESEGTDGTEVLDDGDEVWDDEVVISDHVQLFGQEEKKESSEKFDTPTDEQRSSGIHVPKATPDVKAVSEQEPGSVRRFTSVRAASMRASGLAARNVAFRQMNSESCSIPTDSQFSDQCAVDTNGLNPEVVENISQAQDQGNCDKNSINSRVGCATARKLFAKDCFTENPGISGNNENTDAREDLLEVPNCDGPSAGLSYIDSQEPGELSQANALNFVERFVNDNLMELDDEVDLGKNTGRKSKLISCAKGPQSLAKKTIERSTAGDAGNFEWDSFLEDDGGGDIYHRMKEEFYGNRSHSWKSSTHPQKRKGRKLDESCNGDQPKPTDKITIHSDSKLLLCKSKDNDKKEQGQMNFRKNLSNEFDEQFNLDSSRGQLEATATEIGAAEDPNDVGFDTQMAAEAIEALFYGEAATDPKANQGVQSISEGSSKGSNRGKTVKKISSTSRKGASCSDVDRFTRRSKRTKPCEESSVLVEKHSKSVGKDCDMELFLPKLKKAKLRGGGSIRKQHPEEVHTRTPIAHRTGQSVKNVQMAEALVSDCRKGRKRIKEAGFLQESRFGSTDVELSEVSNAKGRLSILHSNQSGGHGNGNVKLSIDVHLELIAKSSGYHVTCYPKRRRSSQKTPVDVGVSDKREEQSRKPVQSDDNGCPITVPKRSRGSNKNTCIIPSTRRTTQSSVNTCPLLHFANQNSEGKLSHQSSDKQVSGDDDINCNLTKKNSRVISKRKIGSEAAKPIKHAGGNPDTISSSDAENLAVNVSSDKSSKEKLRSPGSLCTTPTNRPTPIDTTSPVCMGEEYFKQSCRKNLLKSSLMKELRSLYPIEPEPISPLKDSRKRRNLADVRVLFSNHLDEDILKQQKKILARLSISEASSISDATHFVTDNFVRTRNMLEAIASGKPVVTHLWLESIGQVNIHIDEEAYVLRDIKKEKELGFCMPVSLARARKRPLLQGRRVLITPNTKPGKETISRLVTSVNGQAVEKISSSAMKDDKFPDDLLVLSCEEDYEMSVRFLEIGAEIYSSELLLNGIVTQRLDYERHRLFEDHVRRTRSTVWLKKDNKFLPVTKV
ncbi:uncharacterized protein LOC120201214 isoform X2 [Hibiscus syriacus]|uniref:uncharacterized protein LOC120201214 isoform X2 n=1 Tax=Hibiscus syriacus TaxID=106335 RepID=UPI00192120BD|nr:uncharacterized protein LOC120201214 isoform X2 [Hibiscus syriacus]